jgi:hypothetical protein
VSERILSTHHSTGDRVYAHDHDPIWNLYDFDEYVDSDCSDGSCEALPRWLYNNYGGDVTIGEVWWPGYDGNYPTDHNNILAGGACSEARPSNGSDHSEVGTVCNPDQFGDYDTVVLKHCFVNSQISANELQSYQGAYNNLGSVLAQSDVKFVFWTL